MSRTPRVNIFAVDADGQLFTKYFYTLLPKVEEVLKKKISEKPTGTDQKYEEPDAFEKECDSALAELKMLEEGVLTADNVQAMVVKVAFLLANKSFFEQVQAMQREGDKSFLVCGSSRESHRTERDQIKRNKPAFFPLLPLLAKKISTTTQPVEFIPFLMADCYSGLPIGTSYRLSMLVQNKSLDHLIIEHAEEYPEVAKVTLLYAHVHGVTDYLIEHKKIDSDMLRMITVFDDLEGEVLTPAHDFFSRTKGTAVPKNTQLDFYLRRDAESPAEAKQFKIIIMGSGKRDTCYASTLTHMVKTLQLTRGDELEDFDAIALMSDSRNDLIDWFNNPEQGPSRLVADRKVEMKDTFETKFAAMQLQISKTEEKLKKTIISFETARNSVRELNKIIVFSASDFAIDFNGRVQQLQPFNAKIAGIKASYAKILSAHLKQIGADSLAIQAELIRQNASEELKLDSDQQALLLAIDDLRTQEWKKQERVENLELKLVMKCLQQCYNLQTQGHQIPADMKPRLEQYLQFLLAVDQYRANALEDKTQGLSVMVASICIYEKYVFTLHFIEKDQQTFERANCFLTIVRECAADFKKKLELYTEMPNYLTYGKWQKTFSSKLLDEVIFPAVESTVTKSTKSRGVFHSSNQASISDIMQIVRKNKQDIFLAALASVKAVQAYWDNKDNPTQCNQEVAEVIYAAFYAYKPNSKTPALKELIPSPPSLQQLNNNSAGCIIT